MITTQTSITKEDIISAVERFNKHYQLQEYVFICNPLEKITEDDLPPNVKLRHNPFCDIGKGYLMKDDPY